MTGPELQPCGTYAAYQRHTKAGEIADAACLAASAEYIRKYRARRAYPTAQLTEDQVLAAVAASLAEHDLAAVTLTLRSVAVDRPELAKAIYAYMRAGVSMARLLTEPQP